MLNSSEATGAIWTSVSVYGSNRESETFNVKHHRGKQALVANSPAFGEHCNKINTRCGCVDRIDLHFTVTSTLILGRCRARQPTSEQLQTLLSSINNLFMYLRITISQARLLTICKRQHPQTAEKKAPVRDTCMSGAGLAACNRQNNLSLE